MIAKLDSSQKLPENSQNVYAPFQLSVSATKNKQQTIKRLSTAGNANVFEYMT